MSDATVWETAKATRRTVADEHHAGDGYADVDKRAQHRRAQPEDLSDALVDGVNLRHAKIDGVRFDQMSGVVGRAEVVGARVYVEAGQGG
eukprot:scaffold218959_cov22-Prasinocladus_malaysianus.AAC.1